jgi:hypothetical protein
MFRLFFIALIFFGLGVSVSCSDEGKDPITVRVFSYASDYSGTYILNGAAPLALPVGSDADLSGLFYGELVLEDVNEVTVDVTTDGDANALSVRIYRDDEKAKDGNAVAETGPAPLSVSLTYEYDDDDEDE